mgnify:CR=1 FL=1
MAVKKPTAAKAAAKPAAKKAAAKKENNSWIGEIEKYSRQIWLAGLGAYSKISNDGNKLFDGLVKDGEKAEKLTKTTVGKKVEAAKATAGSAKSSISDTWGKLEETFDKRLNSAISRLGVPSRNEVKALHQQVDTLTKQIEKLTGISASSVKPALKAAAKPAVKKPAAKPAVKAAAKPVAAKPAAKPAAAKPAAAKPAAAKPAAVKKPAVKKAPVAKPAAPVAAAPVAAPAAPASPVTPS